MSSAAACDVCGAPDRLGLGACAACADGGSALLFLKGAARRSERSMLAGWLQGALPARPRSEEVRDAVAGARPLVALSPGAARRATAALRDRGVRSAIVARDRAWGRLPSGFALCLVAVLGFGLAAGLRAEPSWLVVTPLFAALLSLMALRRARTPLWIPSPGPALALPPTTEREVRRALAELPPGRARRLLHDVARLAAALGDGAEDAPRGVAALVPELLGLSSRAALDLHQLEECLSVLETDPPAGVDEEAARDAIRRARMARDSLVARLGETVAGLGRARAAAVEPPDELHGLLARLEEEVAARAVARHEVEALLR